MNRRDFLRGLEGAALFAEVGTAWPGICAAGESGPVDPRPAGPVVIGHEPQLFLDDDLVDRLEGLERRAEPPERLERPLLDSVAFGCTQPYVTVVEDRDSHRLRLWYNRGPAVWHAESEDGVRWTAYEKNPVLPTWPEGYGKPTRHGVGDIVDVYYDPPSRHYGAAVKVMAVPEDGYAPGPRAGSGIRRLVGLSTSPDFVRWEKPRRIFAPDAGDEGLLEFYGMGAMHLRGRLRIGLVRVLRDDLPCDPGGPADGIGYSVLATSRDGVTWQRRREPFLDRNPGRGSWDHAMSWIGAALPVGDEVFFYYGGYARGHKVAPQAERQIGLVRMKRDRYLALAPTGDEGLVVTRPFRVPSGRLSVNARADRGEVRVRLLDAGGRPLDALGEAVARPIRDDVLAGEVQWLGPLERLRGETVRLEFLLRRASLFAFSFDEPSR